jgi:hypothetical protein
MDNHPAERPAVEVVAVTDNKTLPAGTRPAPISQLSQALVAAQQSCPDIEKDAYNAFHRYHYASAEAIIAAAKKSLAAAGLALLPVEQTLNGFEREGENRYELHRRFALLHSSGECVGITSVWPVTPEKGRPLDKACAIAATLSLSYTLRDLLLMARVDAEDDLPARQDRPQPAATPQPAAAPKPPAKDGARAESPSDAEHDSLAMKLDALMKENGISAEKLAEWLVQAFGLNHWTKLNFVQKQQVLAGLEKRAVERRRQEGAAEGGAKS